MQRNASSAEKNQSYSPAHSEKENLVKSAVNFDSKRGDKVEVVNIPFETTQVTEESGGSAVEEWLARLKIYRPYFKYAFLSLFLILSFVFVVKPLIKWLTAHTSADGELLHQLPKTVGEIENLNSGDQKNLTFTDQASQLILNDNQASVGAMRDWLKEG